MKRYKKLTDTIHYMKNPESIFMEQMEVDNKMIEHPDGKWVEWDDVKKQIVYFGGIPLIGDDVGGGFFVKDKSTKFNDGRCVSATIEIYQKFAKGGISKAPSSLYMEKVLHHGGTVIPVDSKECNCGEMLRDQRNWWICPAHGYKKR